MQAKLYIETTIPSYLVGRPSRDWWESRISAEILKLAEELVTQVPIPRRAAVDAAHIAIATVYGCEYLLTWNCRHIANAELHRAIRRVVE